MWDQGSACVRHSCCKHAACEGLDCLSMGPPLCSMSHVVVKVVPSALREVLYAGIYHTQAGVLRLWHVGQDVLLGQCPRQVTTL
jgi:hypothetical protein